MPYHFKGSDRTKPDPALKEMQPAGVDDLENLAAALKLLQGCKACFVVATARPDHMQDGIHQPWLDRHGFKSLTLRDILPDEQDILFTDAAKVWELTLADSALPALRDHYNGSPALPVRILAFHDTAKRGTTVTAESVHAVAADLLSNDWQTAREQVRSTEPSGIYLFDALADFYLANVASRRNLVLDYAAYLALRDLAPSSSVLRRILTLPRRATTALLRGNRMAMRRTLKRLHRFGVVDQGGVLYYNDIIAAEHMDRTAARDRLADYLPRRRLDFLLARVPRLRRHTSAAQRALLDLAAAHALADSSLRIVVGLQSLAIRLDPSDPTAYFHRGLARAVQGDRAGAVEDYTAAISLYTDPADKAEMYSNRGFNLDVQGDLDAAIEDYTQAIAFYPDPAGKAEAFNNRGFTRDVQGDLDAAIEDYTAAISLFPDPVYKAEAFYNRGLTRDVQGDLDAAVKDYDEAIRLYPSFARAYYHRGHHRRAQGDLDAAIEDYTAAIALYEDVADKAKAYANRSLARSSQGDHAGAAADFTEARRLNPDLTPPPDPSPVNPNLPDSD